MSAEQSLTRVRTNVMLWLFVVVFARLYTVVLCHVPRLVFDSDPVCDTWFRGIAGYLWVELVFYGPVMWFALHQISSDVFGDVPTEARALQLHRRRHLVAEAAIAVLFYGIGVHVADTVEVFSRLSEGVTDGPIYELVYFIDEGVSHYIQFVSLIFVLGWIVIFDRRGRTAHSSLALFLGTAHGLERSVGIIEGEKWFIGPAVMAWMAAAVVLRWRRVGSEALTEFFVRYAVAFVAVVPVAQVLYYAWLGSFTPPSELSESEYAELAVGMIILSVVGTSVALAVDRRRRLRRPSTGSG